MSSLANAKNIIGEKQCEFTANINNLNQQGDYIQTVSQKKKDTLNHSRAKSIATSIADYVHGMDDHGKGSSSSQQACCRSKNLDIFAP